MITETKFIMPVGNGTLRKYAVTLEYDGDRIIFRKSPFAMKDEIKAMQGATWHGFKNDGMGKVWSVKNSPRNKFQLDFLQGKNPYGWFDRELITHEYERPLFKHQRYMTDSCLTYHYQILAAVMGSGKTLSSIEVMERSGCNQWWWIGPKTTLPAIDREFQQWGLRSNIQVNSMTYERMALLMETGDYVLPGGVIFDESSKLKTHKTKRQVQAQKLADEIRETHGEDGYVILMSGTPSPKSPIDIWAQAEIAYPGFLREGSPKALQQRLAVLKAATNNDFGNHYMQHVGWLDQDGLCKVCCQTEDYCKDSFYDNPEDMHAYDPAVNEVALLYERLNGLMIVIREEDCAELPSKTYREVVLEPTQKLLKVAKSVANTAKNTVSGLIHFRQLSDGFMYIEKPDGMQVCTSCNGTRVLPQWVHREDEERTFDAIDMLNDELVDQLVKREQVCPTCSGKGEITKTKRVAHEVPCPKEEALVDWLGKADEDGRMLCFAGFQGSVDRCVRIAHEQGWDVFKCDGRGTQIITADGTKLHDVQPLDYWADTENNEKVVFVANPESGGMGLTLIEARIAVFYSNSYKPEFRAQAEKRLHRTGQTRPVTIVDLFHLPSDRRCLEILRDNRKLEKMVLGEIIGDCFD